MKQIRYTKDVLTSLFRHFPYTEMLATFMPIYAALWSAEKINSFGAFAEMVPFVGAFASGFIYNDIQDSLDPHYKNNPIVEGMLSKNVALRWLLLSLTFTTISFIALFRSTFARISFFIYLVLCLAYSGLGVRLKERQVGPFIASLIIWVGGPSILAIEYRLADIRIILFIVGIFLIYVAREIHHMVSDYLCDRESGYQTLAVRFGIPRSRIVEHNMFLAGIGLLGFAIWPNKARPLLPGTWLILPMFAILLAAVVIQILDNPKANTKETRFAYWLIRLWIIAFAVALLPLPPVCAAFILWAFVTSGRS